MKISFRVGCLYACMSERDFMSIKNGFSIQDKFDAKNMNKRKI